jgi:hypothetical protein
MFLRQIGYETRAGLTVAPYGYWTRQA